MGYCNKCGSKLPDGAVFCPNCGVKAVFEAAGSVSTPSEEVREAISRVSMEMEKAFNVAARELQEAFSVAKVNIQRAIYKEPAVCSNCGEKNATNAVFCFKCGSKVQK
jgi:uncharacterized Zn finger protein (UPF0148 family)